MKKHLYLFLTVLSISFFMTYNAFSQDNELSRFTDSKKPISVYLQNFVNESGQPQVKADEFKKTFERSLLNRKSVKFTLASSPEASDLQISCVIKKYEYLKDDPVNSLAGPTAILLDAATRENYAGMSAEFTVVDTKSGSTLWKNTLSAFVEKMMTPDESVPLVYDKLSRTFLWKSFGKPAR